MGARAGRGVRALGRPRGEHAARHRAADHRRHDARQQERRDPQDAADARRARRRVRPRRLATAVAPDNPVWYHNLKADPQASRSRTARSRSRSTSPSSTATSATLWWERAVAAYPPYAEYQAKTDRQIPVFKATRAELTPHGERRRRGVAPATRLPRHRHLWPAADADRRAVASGDRGLGRRHRPVARRGTTPPTRPGALFAGLVGVAPGSGGGRLGGIDLRRADRRQPSRRSPRCSSPTASSPRCRSRCSCRSERGVTVARGAARIARRRRRARRRRSWRGARCSRPTAASPTSPRCSRPPVASVRSTVVDATQAAGWLPLPTRSHRRHRVLGVQVAVLPARHGLHGGVAARAGGVHGRTPPAGSPPTRCTPATTDRRCGSPPTPDGSTPLRRGSPGWAR